MRRNRNAQQASAGQTPLAARRAFLVGGAAAVGGLTAAAASRASEPHAAPPAEPAAGVLNALSVGAVGDGKTDDTEALAKAIRQAHKQRVGTVYLPAGVYIISDALKLPSDLMLVGAGAGLTTIRAAEGTLFPLFRPDPRTMDIRQRRSMITTVTAGSGDDARIARSGIADLTVDWNHCPTEGYGNSCVLIDRGDHCRLVRVTFTRALASDHPRTLEEMGGSNFRGECVMFSNSDHGLLDGCILCDSGYRPLSVSYGSQDITFQNGKIVAENPVWRHAFAEVHGDRMPRDETYRRSQLKFVNSSFFLLGGTAQDGICSHTGSLVIENCDFHILGGTKHFGVIVKPFDRSHRCQCLNSRFHCRGEYEETFRVFGSIGNPTNEDLVFSGNLVDVHFDADAGNRIEGQGLVDLAVGQRRCRIQDNHLQIRSDRSRNFAAIRFEKGENFRIAGNLIDFQGDADAEETVGIAVADTSGGTVTGNAVTGNYGTAFRITDTDRVAVEGNAP